MQQQTGLQQRRTPCVGICSTTYGDLICRGCKRFAHEIVAWNGYSLPQQQRIWSRLTGLRDACVAHFLEVVDHDALAAHGAALDLASEASVLTVAYEVLCRSNPEVSLVELGLRPLEEAHAFRSTLREAIDKEFYRRSVAHYERNFHTSLSGP